jgi:DtxR family transcriptional regulator, Mn-dependent transcriptional regulator
MDKVKLSASMEDYLEAIYLLLQENPVARSKDIAERLEVTRSSVTGALRSLSKKKLVNYSPYDLITLTATGVETAEGIDRRHSVLREFFVEILGLDEEAAEESACRMEHATSGVLLERLEQFLEYLSRFPPDNNDKWVSDFQVFRSVGEEGG